MTISTQQIQLIEERYIPFINTQLLPQVRAANPKDAIYAVTDFFLTKATKSLSAVCLLCQNEITEDALILGRTILELCLRLGYIEHPKEKSDKLSRARSFIYKGELDRQKKYKRINDLKNQGKCLEWINEIEAQGSGMEPIPDKPSDYVPPPENLFEIANELSGALECQYHFLYWSTSNLVHPSGLGSHTYMNEQNIEEEKFRAIALAFPMHLELTATVFRLMNLDTLWPRIEELKNDFIKLSKES